MRRSMPLVRWWRRQTFRSLLRLDIAGVRLHYARWRAAVRSQRDYPHLRGEK